MSTLPHLAHALRTVLTTLADEAAHTSGFVQRQSKLTGALFAQPLVFGWLDHPRRRSKNGRKPPPPVASVLPRKA